MSKVEQDVEAKEIQQQLEDEIADARASDEHARCDEEADLARGGEVAALVMDYRKFKQEHPEKAWWSDSDQVAYRAAAIRRSHEQERERRRAAQLDIRLLIVECFAVSLIFGAVMFSLAGRDWRRGL